MLFRYFLIVFIGFNLSGCNKVDNPIASATINIVKNAPTNIELTDVFFINQNQGYIVGRPSYFIKTLDAGKTWNNIYPDTNKYNNYEYVYFIDSLKGCVRYNGYISYTADGGLNWNSRDTAIKGQVSRKFKVERPMDGQFFFKNIGIEVNIPDITRYGQIRRSANYGKSWSYINTGAKNNLKGAAFADSSKIILVGDNALWMSFDVGNNWTYYRNQNGESADLLTKVSFQSGTTYFAISKKSIYTIKIPY